MLRFYDIVLTLVHLAVILFNLFGWIPKRTRKAHLICILLTAASWFILGLWFGTGYCPLTDLQWSVKEKLGEHNLPANFIEYFAERITGIDFPAQLVKTAIAVCFAAASLLTIYVNFILPRIKKRSQTEF